MSAVRQTSTPQWTARDSDAFPQRAKIIYAESGKVSLKEYTSSTMYIGGDGTWNYDYSNFLGYKKGANPGDMEIVEEEAVIVRRIYDESANVRIVAGTLLPISAPMQSTAPG